MSVSQSYFEAIAGFALFCWFDQFG